MKTIKTRQMEKEMSEIGEISELRTALKVIHTWTSCDEWSRQERTEAMKDIREHSKKALFSAGESSSSGTPTRHKQTTNTKENPEQGSAEAHRLVLRDGVRPAIKYLQDYINTYEKQSGIDNYTVETFVNDIIYGLGMSLDPDAHKWAKGHLEFEGKLREFLDQNTVQSPSR